MAGIYIHIPFCKQACFYCDFHFSTNLGLQQDMVDALCLELKLRKDYTSPESISTIYFGGGTPSLLKNNQMAQLMNAVQVNYIIDNDVEITLEANPDDISENSLIAWKDFGINRLSIGVQTFNDALLKYMNRAHDSKQAHVALDMARKHDFTNLNVDLIYGATSHENPRWSQDLDIIEEFKPEHISAYSLTIEENTVFGKWLKQGKIKSFDDDLSAKEYQLLTEKLTSMGYSHYEVSNFCIPGMESRHNTGYWKNRKYIGIGPGAHSFNHHSRQFNVSNNARYIKSLKEDRVPYQLENLNKQEIINEYLLTSLRTNWGISIEYIKKEFDLDIFTEHKSYFKKLEANHLCRIMDDRIILTQAGFLLADQITADLMI